MTLRTDILKQKHQIELWIQEHKSKAFMCRELKCKPDTLNAYLIKMGINYTGNQGGKSITGFDTGNYIPAAEYLGTTKFISSHKLKLKLIYEGIKEAKCERCGNDNWLNRPIPLELHHKDGNHWNNDLTNLEILCPNCHALEPNNSGAANAGLAELV